MNVFVLCTNDYPYKVMPEGTTRREAEDCCARLNRAAQGEEDGRPIHYHAHRVEVEEPEQITRWRQ